MANKKHTIEIIEEEEPSYSLSGLVVDDTQHVTVDETPKEPPKKRGPGRPPKSGVPSNTYTDIVTTGTKQKKNEESEFEKGYLNTTKLLFGAIAQSDLMYNNIEMELNNFRENKSYGGRNRLESMSNFMNTQVSLINTKVSAIRELNSSRNKINDLIMKHRQMMKDQGEENSDKQVMDAYYALINAPSYGLPKVGQVLSPMTINTGINLKGNSMPTQVVNNAGIVPANQPTQDQSFDDYRNNLSPVQKRMILSNDPNVKTVVVYDQSTGMKWFDVIDVTTGNSIPGVERPGDFLLDNMKIDVRNGLAVNSYANQTYPLVIRGMRASDEI